MKSLGIALLISLAVSLPVFADCTGDPNWHRNLTSSSYSWYWDQNLNGAAFYNPYGVRMSDAAAKSAVIAAMSAAASKWCTAADGVVTLNQGGPSANVILHFQSLGANIWGNTPSPGTFPIDVYINTDYAWTNDDGLIDYYPDIYTIVLHEMGHVFLGIGHITSDPNSVMIYNNLLVKRDLTPCDVQLTVGFYDPTFSVTVQNSFAGGFVRIDGSPTNYDSPHTFSWTQKTFPHTLNAIDQNWDENGKTYMRRFQDWTKPGGVHDGARNLSIPAQSATYTANFKKEYNVSLTAPSYLESGSGASYKVDGTNVGSTWTGTILQDNSKTIETVPPSGSLFGYWSDDVTDNPRQLSPTDHVTLNATIKNHLQSASSSVTGPNWQRKVFRDTDGRYHLVYVSGDKIWYCRSTNQGTAWSNEAYLSSSLEYGTNKNPTVTILKTAYTHKIYALWERYSDGAFELWGRTIDPSSGALGNEEWVGATGNCSQSLSTMPGLAAGVDASGNGYILAIWFDPSDNTMHGSARNESGAWSTATTLRTGGISSLTAAPISVYDVRDHWWHLAWLENANILHSDILIGQTLSLTTPDTAAHGNWETPTIHNLSMTTLTNGIRSMGIAYEEYSSSLGETVIKYTERTTQSDWGTPVVWNAYWKTPSDYVTPTVSAYYAGQNVAVVWRAGTSQVKSVKRSSGSWGGVGNLTTGIDPMISEGWTSATNELVAYRGSSSPYVIGNTLQSISKISVPNEDAQIVAGNIEGRGGLLVYPKGVCEFAVLIPLLDSMMVPFTALVDSAQIASASGLQSALSTETVIGSGTLQFSLLYRAFGNLPQGTGVDVILVDARTGLPVSTILTMTGKQDTLLQVSMPLQYATRLLKLSAIPAGATPPATFHAEQWYTSLGEGSTLAKMIAVGPNSRAILNGVPSTFALHQNYPNPFNPSTQIDYDLPSPSYVSLVIYDVLGREVRTLASEHQEAGYHGVIWNTSDQSGAAGSSGLYFARLVVTDAAGKSQFSSVRKMLLIR